MRKLFLSVLLLLSCTLFAQQSDFKKFAVYQDSLMREHYNNRNVIEYTKVLNHFHNAYDTLGAGEKQEYAPHLQGAIYNLSCIYSIIKDKKNALLYLDKAVKAGYSDYSHMQKDTDLDFIRQSKEFKQIIAPTREIGDYLYILKKAGQYNLAEKRGLPKFTYQSMDNPNLVALRKAFNLDSIAGDGNEVSKILNLCHWIHELIPHDGGNGNPVVKNALSMINECKSKKGTLNCRGLATVLNECYLAMGFKSRFVTCLPKDSLKVDPDCHVINMVYSNDLQKWLWVDPTFDAYVMNEKGELLSIPEVRERLINNKPLLINPTANWNRKNSQNVDDYLYHYMAKNLYMIESPISSEFDTETRVKGKQVTYMKLIPTAYFEKDLKAVTKKHDNIELITYKTNDQSLFWAKP